MAVLLAASPAAVSASAPSGLPEAPAAVSPFVVSNTLDSDGDGLTDAFEINYGLNPHSPDSDHDGLLDSAEDPDGDLLSNLGEQRFGTSPVAADSDHNGVSDWQEDADHDGIPNGAEQDRRPVPADLKPSLDRARADTPPSYADGCHSNVNDSNVHPCIYGDRDGSLEVAIFGDSHAAQWLPALIAIGYTEQWRIRSVTKSGCPVALARFGPENYAGGVSCRTWRRSAVAWLRSHPPDVIVVSNFRGYPIVDSSGHRLSGHARQSAWGAGLAKLLAALPSSSRLLVLGDTPRMRLDPVECLRQHHTDIATCETTRHDADNPAHSAAERTAAKESGATFRTLSGQVCPYDPCPIVVGRYLIWREESHITATYSRMLAPSLRTFLLADLHSPRSP
jgi:hypothetical protein